jgi:hypothetical protein
MSKTVIVTIAHGTQEFPAGTLSGGINVTLNNVVNNIPSTPYVTTFTDVPAGTYTVTAQAVDPGGNPLGTAQTATVTIPADAPATVMIDVPGSVSVVVQ